MKYQIKDWVSHFENDRSKTRAQCSFVCVPNKQHGMGFCRIMAEPDGAAIYGIWHCLVGACSQQKKRNGWLTIDGEQAGIAWGSDDLSLKFRRPVAEIDRALDFLASDKVGWLIKHQNTNEINNPPPNHRPITVQSPSSPLKEGKKEEKEGREGAPHFPESETPSWKEFWGYCQTQACLLPAEWFVKDKFEAANADHWKNKTDWRAYARRIKGWWEQDGRPMKAKSISGKSQSHKGGPL